MAHQGKSLVYQRIGQHGTSGKSLADQISDGILDALFAKDPMSRVACETLVTTGIAIVAGEITTKAVIDYPAVVRQIIRDVGYTDDRMASRHLRGDALDRPAKSRHRHGSERRHREGQGDRRGDQGLMFGYACNDTPELMPLPIQLAHQMLSRLTDARRRREVDWLRPDGKGQVTVEYDGHKPVRIDTVVLSTQHSPEVSQEEIHRFVIDNIINPVLPKRMVDGSITYHVNPTGRFEIGGPHGDCGLTGRKIIVDTYGGWARHGGGAFSGKDPTKVRPQRRLHDPAHRQEHRRRGPGRPLRSANCLRHRHLPAGQRAGQYRRHRQDRRRTACELVKRLFPLTPSGIIKYLDLRRPIYRKTASGGHFGRNDPDFTWEKTDLAAELAAAAKSKTAVAAVAYARLTADCRLSLREKVALRSRSERRHGGGTRLGRTDGFLQRAGCLMAERLSLQEALNRGVLVFDGAMGTKIYRHHVFTNRSFDELRLSRGAHPADSRRISRRRRRGADDQHLRREPGGLGEVRPGGKTGGRSRSPVRGWPARWPTPPTGRCWWPARLVPCRPSRGTKPWSRR